MKKNLTPEQILNEMAADSDVRTFIEEIQNYFDMKVDQGEVTNKSISLETGIDPSALSRLINGRTANPTLMTVAKLFRAMSLRLRPSIEDLEHIKPQMTNWHPAIRYEDAVQRHKISHVIYKNSAGSGPITIPADDSSPTPIRYKPSKVSVRETVNAK